ncbi:hypothetical protein LCGC14_1987090 [marine sediment metagenome]|uniref:Porphobilinogen deaminase N-terminal domain-containing protein n=1 Tax=marine sediment metagenome TaxID=412755 RepID=A0A0F9F720_9ZZZZ
MTYQLPTPAQPLNIGTRGSLLALAQANEVRDRLAAAFDLPFEAFTIVVIKTTGDRIIEEACKSRHRIRRSAIADLLRPMRRRIG